jgi:hypothetical protein
MELGTRNRTTDLTVLIIIKIHFGGEVGVPGVLIEGSAEDWVGRGLIGH